MMRWISPDKLGSTTVKVSTDFLKQNGLEVVNEWHHSPHGVDLFVWNGGQGEMIKFQLSVLGLIVEWSPSSGLQTGMVLEEENAPDQVNYDAQPLKSTLEYSCQILGELKDLDPSKKRFMIDILGVGKRKPSWIQAIKSWFKRP